MWIWQWKNYNSNWSWNSRCEKKSTESVNGVSKHFRIVRGKSVGGRTASYVLQNAEDQHARCNVPFCISRKEEKTWKLGSIVLRLASPTAWVWKNITRIWKVLKMVWKIQKSQKSKREKKFGGVKQRRGKIWTKNCSFLARAAWKSYLGEGSTDKQLDKHTDRRTARCDGCVHVFWNLIALDRPLQTKSIACKKSCPHSEFTHPMNPVQCAWSLCSEETSFTISDGPFQKKIYVSVVCDDGSFWDSQNIN